MTTPDVPLPRLDDTLPVTLHVPLERVRDLLTAALEGGVGYWATITGYEAPEGFCPFEPDGVVYRHLDYPFWIGGAVLLRDREDDRNLRLDRAAIEQGIALMASKEHRHFADFLDENEDAATGDAFLQLCLLGEIRYS